MALALACAEDPGPRDLAGERAPSADVAAPHDLARDLSPPHDTKAICGCLSNGVCVPGNDRFACGKGGDPCVICAAYKVCSNGKCRPCSGGCDGCCTYMGDCLLGASKAACGKGGMPCETCVGTAICLPTGCKPCHPGNCSGCCDAGFVRLKN